MNSLAQPISSDKVKGIMRTFISFSSKDEETAIAICRHLEARGVSCWISARDIPSGTPYPEAIIDAIADANAFVLVLSDHSNSSDHVAAEVERAFNQQTPIFTVRVQDVQPSKGTLLFLSRRQWSDAFSQSLDSCMSELAPAILAGKKDFAGSMDRNDPTVSDERRELAARFRDVDLMAVARNLVETGDTGLHSAPVVNFGRWAVIDPVEAEQAKTMHAALQRQLSSGQARRTLNLLVSGPAGSGKLFSVQEMARAASPNAWYPINVDLSALRDIDDLKVSFRAAQDAALRGKIALLCIEGVEATLAGVPHGWIQHLVRIMRDGEFMDDSARRPLGPCVLCFVSAGEFYRGSMTEKLGASGQPSFVDEFLSRLDARLDIMGINPRWGGDSPCILRRALVLRNLLQVHKRSVDSALQGALLAAPMYKGGMRSLDAIIVASRPVDNDGLLTGTSLPADGILHLHVDAQWLRTAAKGDGA